MDFWQLLLAVGAKLQHVIMQLAQEVAEKHTAVEGAILVRPSDDHFWFRRPKLVLHLIHFILFQVMNNSLYMRIAESLIFKIQHVQK